MCLFSPRKFDRPILAAGGFAHFSRRPKIRRRRSRPAMPGRGTALKNSAARPDRVVHQRAIAKKGRASSRLVMSFGRRNSAGGAEGRGSNRVFGLYVSRRTGRLPVPFGDLMNAGAGKGGRTVGAGWLRWCRAQDGKLNVRWWLGGGPPTSAACSRNSMRLCRRAHRRSAALVKGTGDRLRPGGKWQKSSSPAMLCRRGPQNGWLFGKVGHSSTMIAGPSGSAGDCR